MDSANSGSMQSSSGGDEEFDSRPAFFNPNFSHLSNPQQQLSLLLPQEHTNFFQSFSQSLQNPNLNSSLPKLHSAESRELRSGLEGPSILNAQSGSARSNGGRRSSPPDQTQAAARNPKKRTRASRRAPTTVLTTDTSNFRAMVQEFTGIPAPPFSAASPYSRRLDLFGSTTRSFTEPVASTLYPLRSLAPKVDQQQSPFLLSTFSSSSSSSAMEIPSEPHQNLLNMQTQIFSFQSLLPSPVLHPSFSVVPNSKSQLPLNSLDEIGMGEGQGQVNANLNSHGNTWIDDGSNNQDHLISKLNNNSSSDFRHEKGLENVPPRGESTVDSWICPSD